MGKNVLICIITMTFAKLSVCGVVGEIMKHDLSCGDDNAGLYQGQYVTSIEFLGTAPVNVKVGLIDRLDGSSEHEKGMSRFGSGSAGGFATLSLVPSWMMLVLSGHSCYVFKENPAASGNAELTVPVKFSPATTLRFLASCELSNDSGGVLLQRVHLTNRGVHGGLGIDASALHISFSYDMMHYDPIDSSRLAAVFDDPAYAKNIPSDLVQTGAGYICFDLFGKDLTAGVYGSYSDSRVNIHHYHTIAVNGVLDTIDLGCTPFFTPQKYAATGILVQFSKSTGLLGKLGIKLGIPVWSQEFLPFAEPYNDVGVSSGSYAVRWVAPVSAELSLSHEFTKRLWMRLFCKGSTKPYNNYRVFSHGAYNEFSAGVNITRGWWKD